MNTRERLEAKIERRREWASKAEQRRTAAQKRVSNMLDGIPMGQPILVGHHSERRHRRDIERARSAMDKSIEEQALAAHHRGKATGLESQLERTIFSDDHDALEALATKLAGLEEKQKHMKAVNAVFRKKGLEGVQEAFGEQEAKLCVESIRVCPWHKAPYPGFQLSNLSANIRRVKERLKQVERVHEDQRKADESPNGVIVEGTDWVRIKFAEKPERSVLGDLKLAGFRWSGGYWCGQRAKIPESVSKLIG